MKIHELKTDSGTFRLTVSGLKDYEIRLNDRIFEVGDELHLMETRYTGQEMSEGAPLEYTGRMVSRRVDYVLEGYGLLPDWVILSVTPI